MSVQSVLIDGRWRASSGRRTFRAVDPATGEELAEEYPISPWEEVEEAINAAARCFRIVRTWPGARFARFLEEYAKGIEQRVDAIVAAAHRETALPVTPRLREAELPRTLSQMRQAAEAAREGSWRRPIIDSRLNIRSQFGPIGPVVVFGPNNFPLAFNSVSGGDFVAAVAAGNPVIAKGHSSHPTTTRLLAEAAQEAAETTEMPPGFVQLIYRTSHEDGCRLVSHRLVGATGYTGSRRAGLVLKDAADRAGKPIYLELSSINPVFVLEGALAERSEQIADEFTASCLLGTGQFCTNPGLVVVRQSELGEQFLAQVRERFESSSPGTLLSAGVREQLASSVRRLVEAGAELVCGGHVLEERRFCFENTLLRVTGERFLENADVLQTEAFGNASLFVFARSVDQMVEIAEILEGNLTGSVYTDTSGTDDDGYDRIVPALRKRVGRLLNDKMPTGVAVTAAMNHGGPYPATGHPHFTAVGIPTAVPRFAMLECYDNVRPSRLPPELQDKNPTGRLWRYIDGTWTLGDVKPVGQGE
ncbi:MAG: aldehyde dehydrogenase (NADP(+)) [Planctomycetota bacterium]|nr:MAG: aldehyde dehydrogenase (NADP(+)) [Planctomycetota bacterium]